MKIDGTLTSSREKAVKSQGKNKQESEEEMNQERE